MKKEEEIYIYLYIRESEIKWKVNLYKSIYIYIKRQKI